LAADFYIRPPLEGQIKFPKLNQSFLKKVESLNEKERKDMSRREGRDLKKKI